ncbi:hypothetical protein M413DRAFT_234035 [Hebeloma cylindrosporum]|uniref:Glycosyl transferase family 25 domain-containing protein n=1 Tax=Hebeloma cylindrosporum TaxID=76867 RepID=A0A0C3C5W4_HEBCY|nr:hypothetical protein M413DRAFT_234035 [Hebeloma cylindrosporum h7]
MASATKNFDISKNVSALPEYLILTEARVACWLGHLSAIHKIANSLMSDHLDFSIILEDDVDMERDIAQQMKRLWPYLPPGWDIVFLGHCWSDEGHGQQLSPHDKINATAHHSSNSQLHVSQKPKCTHAYALSRIGARRLLLHLRYPPFAFSRAIDQAFAWLVESNRVKSYSIVPSLVVQRKVAESDIADSLGGKWKDKLVAGVFEDNGTEGGEV